MYFGIKSSFEIAINESKPPYRIISKGDLLLFCNIDADAGFELDCEVVGKDGDFLDEALNLILVKLRDLGFLLADKVLQVVIIQLSLLDSIQLMNGMKDLVAELRLIQSWIALFIMPMKYQQVRQI